ncbi:hypothetical protein E5R92_04065 [Candidatus Pelagibacter giovannonii]|uniref:Aspartyl/asparaginy/proline hydroxylase domain-containing protein n=1 Tax=Candidatus Pelagibacter giovannonii TaxID=2563896 RepID=A0A6H1Q3X7_9PROT|nr:TIGR02466 family protein [Candidatus Pelagibacter giovannonii]QIZ20955.1 hypothetical protein E5R92_04065 [Candidatus Pelagibacter giovannonii]
MKNFPKFLYLCNFFRLAVYFSKLISIFSKKERKRISFYNFFKKRKRRFDKDLLMAFYRPKIFIFNHDFETRDIINSIYNYKDLFDVNEFTNDGHKNIFQSEHNLNKKKEFMDTSKSIENFVSKNIDNIFNSKKIDLIKMWFVITKQSGIINKHSHFDSDLSGVLYLKVNPNSPNSGLEIFNPLKEMDIYKYNLSLNKIEKNTFTGDKYLFKPKNNDLIIFNSYLEHSVQNKDPNITDRISLPFDLIFKI